jgi:hypothetical protein
MRFTRAPITTVPGVCISARNPSTSFAVTNWVLRGIRTPPRTAQKFHARVLAADGKHRIGDVTLPIGVGGAQFPDCCDGKLGQPGGVLLVDMFESRSCGSALTAAA